MEKQTITKACLALAAAVGVLAGFAPAARSMASSPSMAPAAIAREAERLPKMAAKARASIDAGKALQELDAAMLARDPEVGEGLRVDGEKVSGPWGGALYVADSDKGAGWFDLSYSSVPRELCAPLGSAGLDAQLLGVRVNGKFHTLLRAGRPEVLQMQRESIASSCSKQENELVFVVVPSADLPRRAELILDVFGQGARQAVGKRP